MNHTSRFTRYAVNLMCVLVILFCAAWLLPSAFGLERYVITGGSMTGTIEKGSIAFEREVPVEELKVGDVITYQPPSDAGTTDLVTHRIVTVRSDDHGRPVLRTKGDANAASDPWKFSLQSSTQPVVAFTVPYAGHVFIALADRDLRMAVIGGPAALVALLALGEALRNLRRPGQTSAPTVESMPGQRRRPAPVTA